MGDFNLPVARWSDPYNTHTGSGLHTNLIKSDLYDKLDFFHCIFYVFDESRSLDVVGLDFQNGIC